MDHNVIKAKTVEYVQNILKDAEGGHDWWHVQRVWDIALYIAKQENTGDTRVIDLAALLHDIADAKFHNGDETIAPRMARTFLQSIHVEQSIIDHVVLIIEHISFRKRTVNSTFNTIEFQIVQDADRIEAIGAIGIARVFNYGGFKNRPLYVPSGNGHDAPHNRHTIGHFYDKLLLLKDMMNTNTGKMMAKERHDFMETFLMQFYKEWNIMKSSKLLLEE